MDDKMRERLEEKILGLEIALECEEAVVAKLTPYKEEFFAEPRPTNVGNVLIRRVRQCQDSERIVRNLKEEIADLRTLLEEHRSMEERLDDIEAEGLDRDLYT